MKYPVIGDIPPWNNPRELGILVAIDGVEVYAVPSQDAVVGDIVLGEAGFEADSPYILVHWPDVSGMGNLHGKPVVIGGDNYTVRNIRPKKNTNYVRLILDAQ